jgi:hypothetical protein
MWVPVYLNTVKLKKLNSPTKLKVNYFKNGGSMYVQIARVAKQIIALPYVCAVICKVSAGPGDGR